MIPSPKKITQLLTFLSEMEKMKTVLRRTYMSNSRQENDAEHTFSLLIILFTFETYLPKNINKLKLYKLATIHDVVELYAGDTFPFAPKEAATKIKRELASTKKILRLLPPDVRREFKALNEEYMAKKTLEAKTVAAFDKIQALHQNLTWGGLTYKKHDVMWADILQYHDKHMHLNDLNAAIYKEIFGQMRKRKLLKK